MCSLMPYRIMLSVNVAFSLALLVHRVWNKSQKDEVN